MSGPAWIGFLAAAGIGAPARYLVDGWVQNRTRGIFPWGTLVVNVTGCFLLGVVAGLGLYHDLGATTRTILGTGALGSYTTFSTFSFETVRLAEEGAAPLAALNAAASLLLGLAAVAAGIGVAALI